jgi:ATP-binding cassette subfamily B multidrug efflux pump
MTNGYDSVIQQSGANLSGGQRQRLAIARTLVLEPAILLLDDSTSAVDLETEAHIQTAFEELDGTTVVLVAQRISTALGADEIIVLDEGRIVAHGSHDQLLATSAIYQDIYRSQLGEPADLGQSS